MRLWPLLLILTIPPLTAAAPAPDNYDIRLWKDPTPGESYVVKKTEKTTIATVIHTLIGKSGNPEKVTSEEELVYTETVLEKAEKKDGNLRKFKRAYSRARETTQGTTATLPYEGRTVVFEWKGGKYHASAEGEPALEPKVLDDLAQKETGTATTAASERLFLPKAPVKVGDRWTFDGKEVEKSLSGDTAFVLDAGKSSCEGKLVKAYRKGGKQYGVIELRLKFAIKKTGDMTFEEPAVLETKSTLDGVIDGSSMALTARYEAKMRGRGTVREGGQKVTIDLNTEQSGTQEQSSGK